METSQLICSANQLTGFYIIAILVFNELILEVRFRKCFKYWKAVMKDLPSQQLHVQN